MSKEIDDKPGENAFKSDLFLTPVREAKSVPIRCSSGRQWN